MSTPDSCYSNSLASFDEALQHFLAHAIAIPGNESVKLNQALSRVLANDAHSSLLVPPLDNSAMDGYALNSSDVSGEPSSSLPLSLRICAGDTPAELPSGTAARIFTGAPVPAGADSVVMQEHCETIDNIVRFNNPITAGCNIRRAGEDINKDDVVVNAGTRLQAQHLGLLASIGLAEIEVYRRIRVATFSSGDELLEPGEPVRTGKIFNSNRYTLSGLLQQLGCEIMDLGIVADNLATTEAALERASEADLIITSGGVSVGEEDHLRQALQNLGELSFWRLAMKPGKPVAFGQINGTSFIGLPGNPVSAFVTFLMLAAPFIRKLQGLARIITPVQQQIADFEWQGGKRLEFLRVRNNAGNLQLHPSQGSHVLTSVGWADGLLLAHPGKTIRKGQAVDYLPFSELMS